MTRFIERMVEMVFISILGLILFTTSLTIAEYIFSGYMTFGVATMILLFVLALLWFGKKRFVHIWNFIYTFVREIPAWKLMVFIGIFSAITKIFFVFLFDNNTDLHPDMAMYRSFAEQFANSGCIVENASYAQKFSYTMIYGLLLSPFAKIFGSEPKVFLVVLSIFISIAMILLFDILKKYTGKEIAFVCILVYNMTPMGLFQTQLLTHENGLLFLHILAFWFFIKAFDKGKKDIFHGVFVVLAIFTLAIGKSINAAGSVMFISFGIYAFLKIFQKECNMKKVMKFLCIILLLISAYWGATRMTNYIKETKIVSVEETQDNRMPYGWALYLGMNFDTSGTWNDEDRTTYELYNEIDNKEEALEYQKELVTERAREYLNNPIRIPIHLLNKIQKLWGNCTLPFGYEIGNSVNDFVLTGMGGLIYKIIMLSNSVLYLIIYSILFICKVKNSKKQGTIIYPTIHFEMTVIGVTLALILFEVTPKYVSHLHVLLFAIAGVELYKFINKDLHVLDVSTEGR